MRKWLCFAFILTFAIVVQAQKPLLLHQPAVSASQLVFSYGDDLWSAPGEGGAAHPLTTGPGSKSDAAFSPDGKWVAFTGTYDGNADVYVMPATGGEPKRLTFHPALDGVVGWTPDGKQVLFSSSRNSYAGFTQLFTVSLDGGLPHELPLPEGVMGSFSPDGQQLAYVPVWNWQPGRAWKNYRGGRTARIWIAKLADSSVTEIPRDKNSNDFNPLWIGDKIYFLSDRNGPITMFVYDTRSKKVDQLLPVTSDIKHASAGPGEIVYEQLGSLHKLDLRSGKSAAINVEVAGDLPDLRPHYVKVGDRVSHYALSPTGVRAVFEAHGEILTVPADKGDIRNLTNTTNTAERDPAWSPDGKWIAYFSDENGEYALHLRSQDGTQLKKIGLGEVPSFFYRPQWSPDSNKIAYTDKRLNVWYVDLAKGTPVKLDTNYYEAPFHTLDPAWSPDSRWIAYTKTLASHMRAVFVFSLESGKPEQITDGMSDARYAAFDRDGKYLYFTASTNVGPTNGWLDLSSFARPVTRSVYVVVLRKDLPSPIAPQSDEEKAAQEAKPEEKAALQEDPHPMSPNPGGMRVGQLQGSGSEEKGSTDEKTADKKPEKKQPVSVKIDFENIDQRILALPIPARNYTGLHTGASGTVYLTEAPVMPTFGPGGISQTLYRFELEPRRTHKLLEGISAFALSFDGKKMLYRQGAGENAKWHIASVPPPSKPGEGPSPAAEAAPRISGMALKLDDMQVLSDPRAEWKQEYREVWRIERDFFYDPNLHGVNWREAEKRYAPYIEAAACRADLDYVFTDMLGEMSVGHMNVRPPQPPHSTQPKTGLLGVDYKIENGRYRFAKIYQGENWNPELRAPLTGPGVNVKQGEYLLEVAGRELKGSDNVFSFFQATAGKSVVMKVGSDPSGKGARAVTVVPIDNETNLRNREWIDGNRRTVEQLSAGRVAYVYLPDTAVGGYTYFNRYFYAQIDKLGAVLDERFNRGGQAADYIIDVLRKPLMNYFMTREGHPFTTPVGSIFGPKVMVTNMYAGSGGDALPWYFRHEKIGPLVGTRTWGGLVGIYDYPQLMDGGAVTAPRVAFYNPKGEWDVENVGVPPDYEVPFDPAAWRQGRDPQLEKAVDLVLAQLKKEPRKSVEHQPFPNYHQTKGKATGGGH
ncbi:MAG: PDZ domain-containing protein [Acidobacteriia bacterium]|nr:PDZ domain-containing protein [Terriglobia bacterium]